MTEAGPEQPGLGVGAALSQAREAQKLALADISQQLKFMPRQLEAMEQERFDLLPGPTIARGMVKTYARFLKLDPEPLLARMAGRIDSRDATPQLAERFRQPVPFANSGRRSTLAYLALSGVVLAVAGGVLYQWRNEAPQPQFVAAADLPAPRPAKHAKPAKAAPAIASAEAAEAPAAVPAPVAEKAPPSSDVQKSAPAAAPEKVAATATPKSAAGTHSRRMVFHFDEEAWIEVTDGAGRVLASSLNPAGSDRVIQGTPPFSLVIGNASHVKLSYNDRDVDLQPHVRVEVARFTLP